MLGLLIFFFQVNLIAVSLLDPLAHRFVIAAPFLSSFPFMQFFNSSGGGGGAAATTSPVVSIQAGPCSCSLQTQDLFIPNQATHHHHIIDCHCPLTNSTADASKSSECVKAPEERAVLKDPCLQEKQVEEPWYVKGKSWHHPSRFPRCTMDNCFNYTRCEGTQELLVYTYNEPAKPDEFFKGIRESKYSTDDPNKACLFFVFMDDEPGLFWEEKHPSQLPYWDGGLNHVLITFADRWSSRGPDPESIGYASAMATVMHQTLYRPEFDVGIPLPANYHFPNLRNIKPFDRKYLLTFKGLRYLQNEEQLRSDPSFLQLHNGKDIVVATSCSQHPNHVEIRQRNATVDAECRRHDALYDSYDFADLMNTTFGLAPAGRQPSTHRFAEILSAGAIPVLIADNYVKPFDTLVQWHRCILEFPSTEIHRIVGAVRAMKREEVERRQEYCSQVYSRRFESDESLLQSAMEAQKSRFMGAFPAWSDLD